MKKYQIHIFATKADLEKLLQAIESKQELQFVRAGLFDSPTLNRVTTLLNDTNLGIATKGDNNHETRYLVAGQKESIKIETVPQHGGGTKYAIGSQKVNPKTIIFWPGGVFGETCVIAGSAGTISEDEASLAIFKLFSKEIKQQFSKIKSFYVGKEAGELLDKGWRLTSSVKSPPLYDLTRD
jgi:hypothetical protein